MIGVELLLLAVARLRIARGLVVARAASADHRPCDRADSRACAGIARDRAYRQTADGASGSPAHALAAADGGLGFLRRRLPRGDRIDARRVTRPLRTGGVIDAKGASNKTLMSTILKAFDTDPAHFGSTTITGVLA